MKKRSNFITMLILFFFIAMPLTSLMVNYITKRQIDENMINLVDVISKNKIHVLEVSGSKVSAGMLYVQNAWESSNRINLFVMPSEIAISNDTMRVIFDDYSNVYQGAIMLGNLQFVNRNGDTKKLKEY